MEIPKIFHIAGLSKLKLNENEATGFNKELDKIIEYINKIQKLDLPSELVDLKITHSLNLRSDKIENGSSTAEVLSRAPVLSGNYLVVPKLI